MKKRIIAYKMVSAEMPRTFNVEVQKLIDEGYELAHKDFYPHFRDGRGTAAFVQIMVKYDYDDLAELSL